MGLLSISCFQKPVPSYTFTFFLTCAVFGTISPPPPHFPPFFLSSQLHFHKPYPQSKTFLNIRAVPSSAVFCSNAVLKKTPSSSVQFFSFFNVLRSAPTTNGMTLMLLMFHILLIFLFSSRYLSIFSFSFLLTLVSWYSNINYGTALHILTSLVLIHYSNIWFPCLDISVTLDHNIPQNRRFFIFNNTFWNMFIPFFTSFQIVFPHNFQ